MDRKTIGLHFGNTVYTAEQREKIPFEKGIYFAYPGHFNGEYVELGKLLYIGKANKTSLAQRIEDHQSKDYSDWRKSCKDGESIYYRVASLDHDIENVEAALIYTIKPKYNSIGVDNYIGSRPAPNVNHDLAEKNVCGELVDIRSLTDKIN